MLLKMLHRSYNILKFIQYNVNGCRREQFHIFQIGIAKRHTSTYIKQKLIHVISSSSKLCYNKHVNPRWICSTASKSNADKVKNTIKNKKEKVLATDKEVKADAQVVVQRVVELKEEKLGQLKERALDVEPVNLDGNVKKESVKLITDEKVKKDDKKAVLNDKVIKKGKKQSFLQKADIY